MGFHGPITVDVFESIASPYPQSPHYVKYVAVLLFSIAVHILLFWLAGHHSLNNDIPDAAAKPKNLRLSFTPANSLQAQSPARQEESRRVTADKEIPPKEMPARNNMEKREDTGTQALNTRSPEPTSTRILTTARNLARSLSHEETTGTKGRQDPIAAALAKVFDPQTEPAGVSELSDGTIRVVTELGITYCIRPSDDPGIPGPEDAISLAVTCN